MATLGGAQVAVQSDGKIVIAVDWNNNPDGTISSPFEVIRLNPNGSPDTTFGSDGEEVFDFGSYCNTIKAMTITSGGQIVLAGLDVNFTNLAVSVSVAELNSNGSLDTAFNGGWAEYDVPSLYNVNAVAVDSQGHVIVAGSGGFGESGNRSTNIGIVRFTSTGTLDTNFGNYGVVFTTGISQTVPTAMTIGSANQIDVTESAPSLAVLQFTSTGAVDSSFGTNGVVSLGSDNRGNLIGIATLPTGDIVRQ